MQQNLCGKRVLTRINGKSLKSKKIAKDGKKQGNRIRY